MMAELPQKDFSLDKFKKLSTELNYLRKPNPIYKDHLRMNPRLIKNLNEVEDFVLLLPASAELNSNQIHQLNEDSSVKDQKAQKDIKSSEFNLQEDSLFNKDIFDE